jgi:hypothetical protein
LEVNDDKSTTSWRKPYLDQLAQLLRNAGAVDCLDIDGKTAADYAAMVK